MLRSTPCCSSLSSAAAAAKGRTTWAASCAQGAAEAGQRLAAAALVGKALHLPLAWLDSAWREGRPSGVAPADSTRAPDRGERGEHAASMPAPCVQLPAPARCCRAVRRPRPTRRRRRNAADGALPGRPTAVRGLGVESRGLGRAGCQGPGQPMRSGLGARRCGGRMRAGRPAMDGAEGWMQRWCQLLPAARRALIACGRKARVS